MSTQETAATGDSMVNTSVDPSTWNSTILMELNDAMFARLAPAIAFFVLLMLVGVVGNLVVCYIFIKKLRRSTQNFLLLSLGVFDLLSTVVGIPSEIWDMRHYYLYDSSPWACKWMRFFTTLPSFVSILVLMVIAVDRYRKICKPLHDQIQVSLVRKVMVGIVIVSVVFSVPALYIYGHRTFQTPVNGVYGHDCSVDDYFIDKNYPIIYEAILASLFVLFTAALVSLYIRIWVETRRHREYMRTHAMMGTVRMEDSFYTSSTNYDSSSADNIADNMSSGSRRASGSSGHKRSFFHRHIKKRKQRFTGNVEDDKYGQSDKLLTPKAVNDVKLDEKAGGDIATKYRDVVNNWNEINPISLYRQNMPIEKNKTACQNRNSVQNISSNADLAVIEESLSQPPTPIKQPSNHFSKHNYTGEKEITSKDTKISCEQFTAVNSELTAKPNEEDAITLVASSSGSHKTKENVDFSKEPFSNKQHSIIETDTEIKIVLEEKHQDSLRPNRVSFYKYLEQMDEPNREEDYTDDECHKSMLGNHSSSAPDNGTPLRSNGSIASIASFVQEMPPLKKNLLLKHSKSMQSLTAKRVKKALSATRTTVIASVITLGFILSYLPHLILVILRSVKVDFEHHLSDPELILYNVFIRSYFVNNVINVFVYGSMNLEFRTQIVKLWNLCKRKEDPKTEVPLKAARKNVVCEGNTGVQQMNGPTRESLC